MQSRLALLVVLCLAVLASALPASADKEDDRYYVALGASVTQGFQPIGGPGTVETFPGYTQGFADELFKMLRGGVPTLRLVNLACAGASMKTIIGGGALCSYAHGSQLAEAAAFLRAHPGQIEVITVELGAGDFLFPPPLGEGCFDGASGILSVACMTAALPGIQARVKRIVDTLQAAAPGVPIVGMNYFNSFLGFWVLVPGPVGQFLARAAEDAIEVLNRGLISAYVREGVLVADVAAKFAISDFTLDAASGMPVNVLRECEWTWFCTGPPLGPDAHPNNAGHRAIADAFRDVVP